MKNKTHYTNLTNEIDIHESKKESWVLWLTLPALFLAWIIIRGVMTYFGV